jgi:hypothetical protein
MGMKHGSMTLNSKQKKTISGMPSSNFILEDEVSDYSFSRGSDDPSI